MYKKNQIEKQIYEENNALMGGIVADALLHNYGVFHLERGRDENGVPYFEIGIAAMKEMNLKIKQPNFIKFISMHEMDDSEGEEIFIDWLEGVVFPLLTVEMRIPTELSTTIVNMITFNGKKTTYRFAELSDHCNVYDIIIKVSYQPEMYKKAYIDMFGTEYKPGEIDGPSLWYLHDILNPEDITTSIGAKLDWK